MGVIWNYKKLLKNKYSFICIKGVLVLYSCFIFEGIIGMVWLNVEWVKLNVWDVC